MLAISKTQRTGAGHLTWIQSELALRGGGLSNAGVMVVDEILSHPSTLDNYRH